MHDADSPPDTPPELGMGFEADLQSLTHEGERKYLNQIHPSFAL